MARALPSPFAGFPANASDAGDMVAVWAMNEGAATDAIADSFNTFHLAVTGNPGVAASLFSGSASTGARTFDGSTQYASRAGDSTARTALLASYAIDFLIKPNTPGAGGTIYEYAGVAEAGETANENALVRLVMNSNRTLTVSWEYGSGSEVTNTTSEALTDQRATYVAVVVDNDPDNTGKKRVSVWFGDPPTASSSPLRRVSQWTNLEPATAGATPNQSHFLGAAQSSAIGVVNLYLKASLSAFRITTFAPSDDFIRHTYARHFRTWDQTTLFQGGQYAQRYRVLVEDGDGVMQDLSSQYGYDFVLGAAIEEDIDQQASICTVTLARDIYDGKLGHFVEGSILNKNSGGTYEPLLQLRRKIRVDVACVPLEWTFQGWEWETRFDGYIDHVSFPDWRMQVKARDKIVPLVDAFQLSTRSYSSGYPKDLEDHLQAVIDDNAPATYGYKGGTPTIRVPTSPSWAVNPGFDEQPAPVAHILQRWADNIAWDCRYKWHEARRDYRLTLFEPPRSTTTSVWTFTGDDVLSYDRCEIDASKIRNQVLTDFPQTLNVDILSIDDSGTGNKVEIQTDGAHGLLAGCRFRVNGTVGFDVSAATDGFYTVESVPAADEIVCVEAPVSTPVAAYASGSLVGTRADTDPTPIISTLTHTDTTSANLYGVMPCRLTEDASSMIDTATEADALGSAVLSDLAYPKAEYEITVRLRPDLEIHDTITLPADGQRSDTARDFAITGIRHELAPGRCRTRLRLRASAPAGKVDSWILKIVGYPTTPAPTPDNNSSTPGTPTATAIVGGIRLGWNNPGGRDAWYHDRTEVHTSTTSGFTPSSGTLKGLARSNEFVLPHITPGTTHYAKLVHVDRFGNRSTASAQGSATGLWTLPIPAFRAYLAADQSISASNTADRLMFDTEEYDNQANHAVDAGNVLSTFTAPVRGVYHFEARCEFRYTNTGVAVSDEWPLLQLFKNCTADNDGTKIAESTANDTEAGATAGTFCGSFSASVFLAAGDVVVLKHIGDQAKSRTTDMQGGQNVSYWMGHLVAHVPA